MVDCNREEGRIVLSAQSDYDLSSIAGDGEAVDLASLLYDGTPEEWRRRWRREVGSTPRRELLCNVAEFSRGATVSSNVGGTAPMQMHPDRNLALRTFERPVDASEFVDVVAARLGGCDSGAVVVYLDALGELVSDAGIEDTVVALERLRDDLPPAGAVVCSIDADAVGREAHERVAEIADDVVGGAPEAGIEEAGIEESVDRLRRTDPTNFGYARRHWREAKRGIERSERNYPKAKQIHDGLVQPGTTPRTLGAALKAFVELGIIDVWSETVGPTRYDLTAYDGERLREAGNALDAND